MPNFQENMTEYHLQLAHGKIQAAYRGLMDYMLALKSHFQARHPDFLVSGSLYFGYMDMTYFAVTPPGLKQRSLKVAVVFLHEACRFEVWLGGVNKQVQAKYWNWFQQSGQAPYPLVESTRGEDAILLHTLVEEPNFDDLPALTAAIEAQTLKFISEVEACLQAHGQ